MEEFSKVSENLRAASNRLHGTVNQLVSAAMTDALTCEDVMVAPSWPRGVAASRSSVAKLWLSFFFLVITTKFYLLIQSFKYHNYRLKVERPTRFHK